MLVAGCDSASTVTAPGEAGRTSVRQERIKEAGSKAKVATPKR
jgi:hypothetical protein